MQVSQSFISYIHPIHTEINFSDKNETLLLKRVHVAPILERRLHAMLPFLVVDRWRSFLNVL